mmetsp:Transcript_24508/g.38011  ORF Transcript_24508/g.38011 Transcript_24508/m.38011 type:complete len:224 (+) Transcript_24508:295-966(+)
MQGCRVFTVVSSPLGADFAVDNNDRDGVVAHAVAVDEVLGDKLRLHVDVLNLLGSQVLALRQLEDVFDTINDFNSAVGQNHSHVSALEPLTVESLGRLLRVLEVALHDTRTPEHNFASGRTVSGQVVHVREVSQLQFDVLARATHDSSHLVTSHGNDGATSSLGKAVALDNNAVKASSEEVKDVSGDRGRACDDAPYFPSEHSAHVSCGSSNLSVDPIEQSWD